MLKLDLGRLEKERVQLRQDVPATELLLDDSGIRTRGPVRVDVEGQRAGSDVVVRGRIAATIEVACRRCLAEVVSDVAEPIALVFTATLDADEAVRHELYPLPSRARELDLSEPVREHLLLGVPQYVLCDEACKGLCPQCGTNRNHGTCECRVEERDERWAKLRDLTFE